MLHPPRLRERSAFALVFTLLVSALFVTFLVAAFTRLRLETQVQSNVTLQAEAKQEALHALESALQTLQAHAGRDQSVTLEARASSGKTLVHPSWLGVWSTEKGESLQAKQPDVWLVSGHDQGHDPHTPLGEAESVWLLREGVEEAVQAPLVRSPRETKRRGLEAWQAWWVSDEGMKLRAFTGTFNVAPKETPTRMQRVPTHFAIHTMQGLQGLVPWHPESHKVLRVSQLGFLAASGKHNATTLALRKRYHDLTTHSLSVLSDPHRGGLKTDLSAMFTAAPDRFDTWRDGLVASSPWMHRHAGALRAYHHWGERASWEKGRRVMECQPYLTKTHEDSESERLRSARRWTELSRTQDEVPFEEPKLTPEWMAHAWEWQVHWVPHSGRFELRRSARFRLWNPYHVGLRIQGIGFKTQLPPMQATLVERRKWQSGQLYEPGDEVWYREALYVCIKKPSTQTPQSSGYWSKIARKWSKAQRLEIREPPQTWKLPSMTFEAGAIVDFELSPKDSEQLQPAPLGSDGGGSVTLGQWKPNVALDSLSEWSVILEPLPSLASEFEMKSPHRWSVDYGVPTVKAEPPQQLEIEQTLLWGKEEKAWLVTKRMRLPNIDFEALEMRGMGRGLVLENTIAFASTQAQRWPLGVLGYQFSALDEAPLLRGPKGLDRAMTPLDPRCFTNASVLSQDAPSRAAAVEIFCFESNQGKKLYRLPALAELGLGTKALYEIPATPLLSLGQWQHYPFRQDLAAPAYGFANSDANGSSGEGKDPTHRLHAEIWDRYFFSGLSSNLEPCDFYHLRGGRSIASAATHPTASQLYLKGGFNVNSQRVEAWKGLLNAALALPLWEAQPDGGFRAIPSTQVRYPRQSHSPMGVERKFTEKQVSALAEALVKEIRARGPFRSMSEFLNRPVASSPSELSQEGTIEAALIQSSCWLDPKTLASEQRSTQPMLVKWSDEALVALPPVFETLPKDKVLGSEHLLQAGDLLQVLAPYLVARSDTFKVRAYGEIRDRTTGKRLARAWCEALVQRFPEYVKSEADAPEVPPVQLKDALNRQFGRKFEILHLKWLAPDEV